MEISELCRYRSSRCWASNLSVCSSEQEGVVGDRAYAVIDASDGKVASAKNPRKWRALLSCSAAFVDEPSADRIPPVRITLPDGRAVMSDSADVDDVLSAFLGRQVTLAGAAPSGATFEENMARHRRDGSHRVHRQHASRVDEGESVSDLALGLAAPPGSFFDLAPMHLVTTSSLAELARLQPASTFDVARFRPNVVISAPHRRLPRERLGRGTVQLGPTCAST